MLGNARTQPLPAADVMLEALKRAIPGSGPETLRLRRELLSYASSPKPGSVLLRCPSGSGPHLPRLLALLIRVAPLRSDEAARLVRDANVSANRPIDLRFLSSWYSESLASGLAEGDAERELFGLARDEARGLSGRPGAFERAMRMENGESSAGSLLTGGIVHLQEPGDLSATLQARALAACRGVPLRRIGAPVEVDSDLEFSGVVISTTWRAAGAEGLRPDVAAHLAQLVIEVPSLAVSNGAQN